MPHIEFTVAGPPVSQQGTSKRRGQWKQDIRTEALKLWADKPPLSGKLKCTIIYFHEGNLARLDDDNMVKPIRDALNGLVYADDSQIVYSETIQLGIDAPIKARGVSQVILMGYNQVQPFVYVRIDDAPAQFELPG